MRPGVQAPPSAVPPGLTEVRPAAAAAIRADHPACPAAAAAIAAARAAVAAEVPSVVAAAPSEEVAAARAAAAPREAAGDNDAIPSYILKT